MSTRFNFLPVLLISITIGLLMLVGFSVSRRGYRILNSTRMDIIRQQSYTAQNQHPYSLLPYDAKKADKIREALKKTKYITQVNVFVIGSLAIVAYYKSVKPTYYSSLKIYISDKVMQVEPSITKVSVNEYIDASSRVKELYNNIIRNLPLND